MASQIYHFHKASEGGRGGGRSLMLKVLKAAGINARPAYSPHIGHVAVEVIGGERDQRRAASIIL